MPIKLQTKIIGVLYLENSLVAGAFTAERLAALEVLASQAAISLENAILYSDLQSSRNELQSQTLILRSMLDSIGDGVVVINELSEFILLNPAAEELLGFKITTMKPPERLRQSVGLLPNQAPPHSALELPLVRALQGESVDGEEIYIHHSQRSQGVWLSVTARPLTNQAGATHGAVAVFSDITVRKHAEQEIRSLNAELEQRVIDRTKKLEVANKELESFSYSVSHDLRAPLRSIDGFSRILEEDHSDKLDEEGRQTLKTIRVSAHRMSELIEDMLRLSRVSLTELRRGPVDLSALAREVGEELRKNEPQRSVELVIQPGLIAQADGHLMRIVLENLLSNAWKFTGRQASPRIEFGRDRDEAYFIRDNGAGFDTQFANKLFQAFQRLHTQSEFPGTGVGLATVYRVIQRHGGRMWAESERGRGAAFFFTLPDEVNVQATSAALEITPNL
jgi:PAS domain S-box-containing protein